MSTAAVEKCGEGAAGKGGFSSGLLKKILKKAGNCRTVGGRKGKKTSLSQKALQVGGMVFLGDEKKKRLSGQGISTPDR